MFARARVQFTSDVRSGSCMSDEPEVHVMGKADKRVRECGTVRNIDLAGFCYDGTI